MGNGGVLRRVVSLGLAITLLLSPGCATHSQVVKKSAKELTLLEKTADHGREEFFKKSYQEASNVFSSCACEQHVNQPLYKCELASVALLSGDKVSAEADLKESIHLLEVFYDKASEKKATSLWGRESEKVYKGDPYERATLYTLYGMVLLEKGDVDNALASFKRALLMDGDTEQNRYQSDFGLVQLLAAKCYDLRRETELRDTMLKSACESYLSRQGVRESFEQAVKQDYELSRGPDGKPSRGPTSLLANLCSWSGADSISQRCGFSEEIKSWLIAHAPADKGMGFNTVLVGWNGRGPFMSRAGEYGEKRIIHAGYRTGDFRQAYSCCSVKGGEFHDGYGWLGDISYQATTRGGRKMDNVLADKAAFKATTDFAGDAMIAGGVAGMAFSNNSSSDPYSSIVFGAIALGGFVFKGVSALTKTEADVRCWQCLPHDLIVAPLSLPEGDCDVTMTSWVFTVPVASKTVRFSRRADSPVTFVHLTTPDAAAEADFYPGYFDGKKSAMKLLSMSIIAPDVVDPDGDGEITDVERQRAIAEMNRRFDSDGNGILDDKEQDQMNRAAEIELEKRMGSLETKK